MGGWAIAVHGGAGVDPNLPLERQEEAKQLLTRCLNLGISALNSNLPAIDVVELVVHLPRTHTHTFNNCVPKSPHPTHIFFLSVVMNRAKIFFFCSIK